MQRDILSICGSSKEHCHKIKKKSTKVYFFATYLDIHFIKHALLSIFHNNTPNILNLACINYAEVFPSRC